MKKRISIGDRTLEVEGMMIPIEQMIPNYKQPRMANILDSGLRRSILETKGLVQPLLVERIINNLEEFVQGARERYQGFKEAAVPEFLKSIEPKYLIIDGERRWANSIRILSEQPDADYIKNLPCDAVTQPLSEKERYILWISIHRMRKEWKAMEKETAARHLIQLTDPANAAAILGITLRSLDKFIEIYDFAQRMKKSVGERAISYAREAKKLAKKRRTVEVENAIVDKVNRRLIKDSVDIRKLTKILDVPEAKEEFLKPNSTIEFAIAKVPTYEVRLSPRAEFKETVTQFTGIINNYSWRQINSWKGDAELVKYIDGCINSLKGVREALA